MKKRINSSTLKLLFLAVPASALMLGSSQAQTSVGINFQGSYGGSYAGSPVTVTAFGLPATSWFTDASDVNTGSTNITLPSSASLTVNWNSADTWCSGLYPEIFFNGTFYTTPGPYPGDGQVLWGYLDDPGGGNLVSVSGLSTAFPNGYVIQTIAAEVYVTTFVDSIITAGTTNESLAYSDYWYPTNFFGPPFNNTGTAGLSVQSIEFTNDAITITGGAPAGGARAPLCGFIITDMPVVSQSPVGATENQGAAFTLSAGAIGIPPLSYQWQLNGSNLLGATAMTFTNADAGVADSGNYDVVVTNLYGATTSQVAVVTVLQVPTIQVDLPAAVSNYSSMNASFSVLAGGAQPLYYTWIKDGGDLSITNSTLDLTNLQTSAAGSYQVIVNNSAGSATSAVVVLTVLTSPPPYEGFNYSPGDLAGQSGGVGWTGVWTEEPTYNGDAVTIPALAPWIGGISQLDSTGGSLELAGTGSADYDDIRSLLTTLGGQGSGTIYLSFEAQVTNTTWGGIELVQDGNATLFLGSCWEGANWGWGTRAAPIETTSVSPFTCSLLVYRFDFTPTTTAIRLYVNPQSLSTEPEVASASGTQSSLLTFDQVRIVSHGYLGTGAGPDGVMDEIRLGGTWASVTPHTLPTNAPFSIQLVPGGVIEDTKPVGTPHPGLSYNTTWTNSLTDGNSVTRTGVEKFSASNNGQITIVPNSDFDSTTGTICFWMLYDDVSGLPGPGNEAAMLFDRRTTNGTIIGLNISGGIEFQAADGINHFVGTTYVVDGNWHEVAITYDQSSNGVVSLYVDGNLDTSQANTNVWSWPATQEIELGRSHDSYWYIYDGSMDDFRMYNTILTAPEISAIATASTSDSLEDTNALVVRFNFDSGTNGYSLVWPFGTLQSSPALSPPGEVWTTLSNAVSPMPFLPTNPATFYRLFGTP